MPIITRESLLTLEAYARDRKDFRARVLEHKKARTVHLGQHLTLLFEDELTIRYQVQEMLRIEKIFEEAGIQDELDTYNPLVPDGRNWKATLLVEYEDVEERKRALARLKGIEDRVWVQVDGQPRVQAIADEDLERENLGFWIGRPYWGRGYATAAARAVIALAFGLLDIDTLTASHLTRNPASGRVMEKCGMSLLGTETRNHRGVQEEFCVRGITRDDWERLIAMDAA